MDADKYLKNTTSDIIVKEVDDEGKEIIEEPELDSEFTQNNMGIS